MTTDNIFLTLESATAFGLLRYGAGSCVATRLPPYSAKTERSDQRNRSLNSDLRLSLLVMSLPASLTPTLRLPTSRKERNRVILLQWPLASKSPSRGRRTIGNYRLVITSDSD